MISKNVSKQKTMTQLRIFIADGTAACTRGELINLGYSPDNIRYRDVVISSTYDEFIAALTGQGLSGVQKAYTSQYTGKPIYETTLYLDESRWDWPLLYGGRRKNRDLMLRFLYTEGYVKASTPFNVILSKTEKGVYFKSRSLRPDIWGMTRDNSKSKYFFVDNKYSDSVCAGLARVTTIIFEKDRYGIVGAEMVKMEMPSTEAIVDRLANSAADAYTATLRFKKHPLIGEYVYIMPQWSSSGAHVLYSENGEVKCLSLRSMSDAAIEYREAEDLETMPAVDFVCQNLLGQSGASVINCEVLPKFIAPGDIVKAEVDDVYVDTARASKWVEVYQCGGTKFARFNNENIITAITSLGKENFLLALEACNRMNSEFNAAIARKIKKGKLSINAVVVE